MAINRTSQNWANPPGEWQNLLQVNFSNNTNGTVDIETTESWDSGTNTYNVSQQELYTYNDANQVLTRTSQSWIGSWVNSYRSTNTYDASGYLVNSLSESWDFIGSAWENNSKSIYTNNASGTILQIVDQNAIPGTTSWLNSDRYTYTYNGANQITEALTESWVADSWQNSDRLTQTHSGGNLVNELNESWDDTSTWVNSDLSIYTKQWQRIADTSCLQIVECVYL